MLAEEEVHFYGLRQWCDGSNAPAVHAEHMQVDGEADSSISNRSSVSGLHLHGRGPTAAGWAGGRE